MPILAHIMAARILFVVRTWYEPWYVIRALYYQDLYGPPVQNIFLPCELLLGIRCALLNVPRW